MIVYRTKKKKLSGSSFKEIEKRALTVFEEIKSKTKRTPYIKDQNILEGRKYF